MMFIVSAKCGHVRRSNYVIKEFPVIAENKKDAARIVRQLPRVKHHHKDAIREVKVIDYDTFCAYEKAMSEDPYFNCRSIQEQRRKCPDMIVFPETDPKEHEERKSMASIKPLYIGKDPIRHPKRYMRMHAAENGGWVS